MGNENSTNNVGNGNTPTLSRMKSSNKSRLSMLNLGGFNQGKYNFRNKTLIERMFEDLAKRSPNKTMSKDTFLEYFALPGILGERLFQVFDTRQDGVIHYDEFVDGLARYNEGTMEDKIEMLFEMFDMDGRKQVNRNELSMILYSLITPTTSLFYSNQNGLNQKNDQIIHKNRITKNSVETLVNDAFSECDTNNDNLLSYGQFTMWVKKNPNVLGILETTLAKHMWSGYGSTNNGSNGNINLINNDSNGIDFNILQQSDDSDNDLKDNINGPNHMAVRSSSALWNQYATPRKSMPHGFEEIYNALQEQYKHDSTVNDITVAECTKCKIKYYKSLANKNNNNSNNDDEMKSRQKINEYTEYVFWKKNGVHNADIKYCCQCGSKLVLARIDIKTINNGIDNEEENIQPKIDLIDVNIANKNQAKKIVSKSGDLWKLGRKTNTWVSRYYVIKDKFLYQFKTKKSDEPQSVLFISGWFFTEKNDEFIKKGYYGIEIHPPHGQVTYQLSGKMLYAKTNDDRIKWIKELQIAASTVAIQQHYTIGKPLGKGHFSVVHLGTHKVTNKKYAIKIIEKKRIDAREKLALRNEIAIMKLVDHPSIIRMNDVYEDRKCIYMVMTLVPFGDFFERWQKRKRFKENIAKIIIWKLFDATHYLHSLGIVHRDLKPENMLCLSETDDTQIVISDFGLSKFAAPHTEMTMPCGTLAYVAPEVLLLKKQIKGYDKKVDLWSIGCIMHLLLRGILPFDANDKSVIIEKTLNKKLVINRNDKNWKHITDDAIDLLYKLLKKNPHERIDLNTALSHKWFNDLELSKITKPKKDIKAMVTPNDSPIIVPSTTIDVDNNDCGVNTPKKQNNNNNNNVINNNDSNNVIKPVIQNGLDKPKHKNGNHIKKPINLSPIISGQSK